MPLTLQGSGMGKEHSPTGFLIWRNRPLVRALREESFLASHRGAAYEDYARDVPRILPLPSYLKRTRGQRRADPRGEAPKS